MAGTAKSPLRLAVLDVDGTLKQAESPYAYLHERLGLGHLAAEHRSLALAGRISYGEWLRRDVALWRGQPVSHLAALLAANPYLPGALDFVAALKRAGIRVALVSAGFTLNTDPVAADLCADDVLANELGVVDGVLDGTAVNRVPEGGKGAFVRALMARHDIAPEETLAAGDTHGDLELFEHASVRLAVNPRSAELRARATAVFEPDLVGAVAWLVQQGYLAAAGD
ncbi:MAG: Phosphoserine phosphatase [Chloroflexi bacterium ADurb.Bin325]|nr:MAG: Phosphoserine phosphatase [Chloroflexi bacterium ADurb.Bin325]